MPKKKSSKKGKQSDDGKKKKVPIDVLTFKEAVMLNQVGVKEAQLNDVKEDIDDVKFRNARQKQKNEFLLREQNRHMKDVIEQARKKEEEAKSEEKTPFEDVEKALQEKLVAIRAEKESVEEVKRKIDVLDEDMELLSKELHQILNYKMHGQKVDRTHIEVLTNEIHDMDDSYAEMKDFFRKSLEAMKCTITKQNEENFTKHKKLASERAIHNLDRHTEQEFLDNKWLLREVEINRKHIQSVQTEVEVLEKENIEIMSGLFEQQFDDSKDTRQFYLACEEDQDDEINHQSFSISNDDVKEVIKEHGNMISTEDLPDDIRWLNNYMPPVEEVSNEQYNKLGPMEMKLLCVRGTKIPIYQSLEEDVNPSTCSREVAYKKRVVEIEDFR